VHGKSWLLHEINNVCRHDWPHINYIVEGRGVLHVDGRDTPIESGSYAFVPAGSTHQFRNAGSGRFRFICIVPTEGHQF